MHCGFLTSAELRQAGFAVLETFFFSASLVIACYIMLHKLIVLYVCAHHTPYRLNLPSTSQTASHQPQTHTITQSHTHTYTHTHKPLCSLECCSQVRQLATLRCLIYRRIPGPIFYFNSLLCCWSHFVLRGDLIDCFIQFAFHWIDQGSP